MSARIVEDGLVAPGARSSRSVFGAHETLNALEIARVAALQCRVRRLAQSLLDGAALGVIAHHLTVRMSEELK